MVETVSAEPVVTLTDWHFVQEQFRGYRLAGLHGETGIPRITSDVVDFDPHGMTATTRSGRLYHLSGEANVDLAAQAVRAHMARWGLSVSDIALAELDDFLRTVLPQSPRPRH